MRSDVEMTVLEVECFDQTWSKITKFKWRGKQFETRIAAKTGTTRGHYRVYD